jgi:hypothetical protein
MSRRRVGSDKANASCEDASVADSADCVVCGCTRHRDDQDHAGGELFICAQCQADAAQLFAIQDSIDAESTKRRRSQG